MVRKKSVAAKLRKRKENYKQKINRFNAIRSWRILILVMKAVKIFLKNRRDSSIAASLPPNFGIREPYFVPSNCIGFIKEDIHVIFPDRDDVKEQFAQFQVVKDVVKKLVSNVCRREHEQIRQKRLREKKRILIEKQDDNQLILRKIKKNIWFKEKYRENAVFRKKKIQYTIDYFRRKYKMNKDLREKRNSQMKNKYQTNNQYHANLRFQMWNKYRTNTDYHEYRKNQIRHKYHTNNEHREIRKSQLKHKYHTNNEYRENRKKQLNNKYEVNKDFRERLKIQMKRRYQMYIEFREKYKRRMKIEVLKKYHSNENFRKLFNIRAKRRFFEKYHNDKEFRENYKRKTNQRLVKKYNSDSSIRLKKIVQTLKHYRLTYTPMKQNQRRLYNQSRRIINKYRVNQSHKCKFQHRDLYLKYLKEFREKNQDGPDYICISCRLALFRNQVIPFVEEKYINEDMPYELKEKIQSYIAHQTINNRKWICRYCSDKIKKGQMPSRCIENKLEPSDVPDELKKLNDLERHIIALRLPFLKIVNLTSGKISGRFAQKGTKGPLHCVPSDVQETITALPRPIDKSMMIRLQLKRRLKYKAIWEEQLINPNDVRNALIILTKRHPGYRNISINEINENYLTSDRQIENNIEDKENT